MEWVVDGCGGILRKDSATFSSPNYPNVYPISVNYYFLKEKCFRKSHEIEIHLHIFQVTCEWKIETTPGTKIELTIKDFDLEGSRTCRYDSLAVYAGIKNVNKQLFPRNVNKTSNRINIFFSGPDDTSPKLTELCEKRIQNVNVTSMGNHMFVRFKSDASIRGKGFTASYTSSNGGCGGRMIGKFE